MNDLKHKLEALLFAYGKKVELADLCKLVKCKEKDVLESLHSLQKEYGDRESSLMIFEEGSAWKLMVRERYVPLVRNIVTETELSKSVMETLAVIAWKYPVLQSDVIKIRTNKAYDHLAQLEEAGFITRKKFGRTNKLTLTPKFFSYFDLPEKDVQDAFRKYLPVPIQEAVMDMEKLILEKERVIDEKDADKEQQKLTEEDV